jgi:hypothetical protein
MRLLTRDTLVLLGQIANRLADSKDTGKGQLNLRAGVHAQIVPAAAEQPITLVTPPEPEPASPAAPVSNPLPLPRAEERPARPDDRARRPEVSAPKIRRVGERS